jgi:hypothetical protein
MLRWLIYSWLAITWWDRPIRIYAVIVGGDIIGIIWTILAFKSFRTPSGCLILISEIFVLFRHVSSLAFFGDMKRGGLMKQGAIDFWTHIGFWSYIVGTLVEVALWFEPYFNRSKEELPVEETERKNFYEDDL